tara:strand:+ start:46 stop:969 length:924 start_codon:yes stop_codon:yes gene_type:complete
MSIDGNPVCHVLATKGIVTPGFTRQKCEDLSNEMALTRQCRAEMSTLLLKKKQCADTNNTATEQLTELFHDVDDHDGTPMHTMPSTGQVISAKRAAGACMPTATDVLARGHDHLFLKDILQGTQTNSYGQSYERLGINPQGWEFMCLDSSDTTKGPADYDFNWARLTAFTRGGNSNSGGGGGGGGGGGNSGRTKSVWTNSTKVLRGVTKAKGLKVYSLMDVLSMTFESQRDTLFLIAQNQVEMPKKPQLHKPPQTPTNSHKKSTQKSTKSTKIHKNPQISHDRWKTRSASRSSATRAATRSARTRPC